MDVARFVRYGFLVMTVNCIVVNTAVTSSLPAVIGQTVTLTCKTVPTNQTLWQGPDGNIIAIYGQVQTGFRISKYSIYEARAGEQALVVRDVTMDDDGVFTCVNMKNKTDKVKTTVNVLVRPTALQIDGPTSPVDERTVQNITCQSCGGKPLPDVTWVMTERDGRRTEYFGQNNDTLFANLTGCRRSTLEVLVTRRTYKSRFTCQVKITYLYSDNASLQLDVMLFPLQPSIITSKIEYDAGETIRITCVSRGSRPASRVRWLVNNHPINASSFSTKLQSDGTYTVISTTEMKLLREHDDAAVWCDVTNDVLANEKGDPVNTSMILHVNYAPVVSTRQSRLLVNEGANISLSCDVSSRPLPRDGQIWWTHDGEVMSTERFVMGNVSRPWLTIISVSRLDAGNYVCVSRTRLGAGLSSVISLRVNYSPVCRSMQHERFAVHVGDSINITCDVIANSKYVSITWLGDVNNVTLKQWVAAVSDDHVTYMFSDWLTYSVRSFQDYDTVRCLGRNDQGQMKVPCMFDVVQPSKPEPPSNCSVEMTGRTLASIHCIPGFNGGSEQSFILTNKTANVHVDIERHQSANFTVRSEGGNYTFVVCAVNIEHSTSRACGEDVLLVVPTGDSSTEALPLSASTVDVVPYAVAGGCLLLVLAVVSVGIAVYLHRKHQKHPVTSNTSRSAQSVAYVRRKWSDKSPSKDVSVPHHQTTMKTSDFMARPVHANVNGSDTLDIRSGARLVDMTARIHLQEKTDKSSGIISADDVADDVDVDADNGSFVGADVDRDVDADDVDADADVRSYFTSFIKHPHVIGNVLLSSYHDSIPCRRGTAQSSFFRSESRLDQDSSKEQRSAERFSMLPLNTDGLVELPTDYHGYLDMTFSRTGSGLTPHSSYLGMNKSDELFCQPNSVKDYLKSQDSEMHEDKQRCHDIATSFHNYINIPIQQNSTDKLLDTQYNEYPKDKKMSEVKTSVCVLDNESNDSKSNSDVIEIQQSPIKHFTITDDTFTETSSQKSNTTDQHYITDEETEVRRSPSWTSDDSPDCQHSISALVGTEAFNVDSLHFQQKFASMGYHKESSLSSSPLQDPGWPSDDVEHTSSTNEPDTGSLHVSFSLTPPLRRKDVSKVKRFHLYRTDYL